MPVHMLHPVIESRDTQTSLLLSPPPPPASLSVVEHTVGCYVYVYL
jgi:hypothetical protein